MGSSLLYCTLKIKTDQTTELTPFKSKPIVQHTFNK